MPSIPHSFVTAVTSYVAPLVALLVALALPFAARGKAWVEASSTLALFAGWAMLHPIARVPRAIAMPHRGTETLLAPALVCAAGVAIVAWRGGRQTRLVAFAMAAFAGWWVARDGVNLADFWRVGFGVAALTALLNWVLRGRADRLLVFAAALWGGLAVAGLGKAWLLAALVVAGCAAGSLAGAVAAGVPAAALAALMGATELAGGRLLRGRLDAVDIALAISVAAPLVTETIAGRLPRRFAGVLAPVISAVGAVAIVWLLWRGIFT